MDKNMTAHELYSTYYKKLPSSTQVHDNTHFVKNNRSVADEILRQTTTKFSQKHFPKPSIIPAGGDLMKRVAVLQQAGYITNANVTHTPGKVEMSVVVEFTVAGVDALLMRDLEAEALDTEFLDDQIAEYSDQIPKAFLEGLKAAEGILRGTDFLENYIETK